MELGDHDINLSGMLQGGSTWISGSITEGDPCEVWVKDGETYYQKDQSKWCLEQEKPLKKLGTSADGHQQEAAATGGSHLILLI